MLFRSPDMVAVLLAMQQEHGLTQLPYDLARAYVSKGGLALVRLAFPEADDAMAKQLHQEFLHRYESAVCVDSALFPKLGELLNELDATGRPWGIVTNKPRRMTEPLLVGLGIASRAACAISGDTILRKKPDPAPLLLASRQIGVPVEKTVYIGDAVSDIDAGRAAGMFTIAASYGYITEDDDPGSWGADLIAGGTRELTNYLLKGVNLDR